MGTEFMKETCADKSLHLGTRTLTGRCRKRNSHIGIEGDVTVVVSHSHTVRLSMLVRVKIPDLSRPEISLAVIVV